MALMGDRDFAIQVAGYGLSTVQVHYYLPDHPSLLQLFVMQQYDIAPGFPELDRFLDYWRREVEAVLRMSGRGVPAANSQPPSSVASAAPPSWASTKAGTWRGSK